ncbi:hypothetical protein JTB14_036396 [Gonioctena quinquepunctata]|nr:hypothetical protein JTB14_036396 [Gonioctena quinquepunctata]
MAETGKTCEQVAPQKTCRKCKNVALTGKKCIQCDSVMHNSCAKLLKTVIHTDGDKIICCGSQSEPKVPETDDEGLFNDATDDLTSQETVNVRIVNYLLKQKDIIINELREKIDSLYKQIELVAENNELKKSCTPQIDKKEPLTKSSSSEKRQTVAKNNNEKVNHTEPQKNLSAETSRPGNSVEIKKSDVAFGLLQEETAMKMNEIISLGKQSGQNSNTDPSGWKKVERKRKQSIFPDKLKIANVVPIPKANDHNEAEI